jgi:hypothetical protein
MLMISIAFLVALAGFTAVTVSRDRDWRYWLVVSLSVIAFLGGVFAIVQQNWADVQEKWTAFLVIFGVFALATVGISLLSFFYTREKKEGQATPSVPSIPPVVPVNPPGPVSLPADYNPTTDFNPTADYNGSNAVRLAYAGMLRPPLPDILLRPGIHTIGRNGTTLIDGPGVSRDHAGIKVEKINGELHAYLTDLNSTNGTWRKIEDQDGWPMWQQIITKYRLQAGDTIAFGHSGRQMVGKRETGRFERHVYEVSFEIAPVVAAMPVSRSANFFSVSLRPAGH